MESVIIKGILEDELERNKRMLLLTVGFVRNQSEVFVR